MTVIVEDMGKRPRTDEAEQPKPWQRLVDFGRPPRIVGLDIARGLAVIGMIAAHTAGIETSFDWTDLTTWADLVNGRSAILFALLAGISIALMTGRTQRPDAAEMPAVRLRLVGRGAVIFAIGVLLEQLGTNIAVILTFYGVLYVIALPFLRARRRTLILWSAGLALLGPVVLLAVQTLTLDAYGAGVELLFNGVYSLPVWASLMLAGLAIGRSDLTRKRVAASVLGIGVVLSAVGYGAGAMYAASGADGSGSWTYAVFGNGDEPVGDYDLGSYTGGSASTYDDVVAVPGEAVDLGGHECEVYVDEWVSCWPVDGGSVIDDGAYEDDFSDDSDWSGSAYSGWSEYSIMINEMGDQGIYVDALLSTYPHSGSTAELLGSGGFAMALVGLLLLIGRWLRWPLLPVAALGAMPLTAYTAHIVWIFVLVGPGGTIMSATVFWLLTGSLALLCTVWLALFGRGPLERLTRWVGIRLSS